MEKGVHIPLRGYSPGPKTETCSPMDSGPNCQECSRVDSLRQARRQKYLWPPPVRKGFIFERRKKNTMSIKPPVAHLVSEWVKSPSRVQLFATPWTVAYQAPPSMEFSRQEYWSGLPFPSPGDLPNPGIEPGSPALQADALPSEPPGKPSPLGTLVQIRKKALPQDP